MNNNLVEVNIKFNESIDGKYINEDNISIKDMKNNNILFKVKLQEKNILNIKLNIQDESSGEYVLEFKNGIYSKEGRKLEGANKIKFFLGKDKVVNNGNRVVKEGNWIYYSGNKKFYTYVGYSPYGEMWKMSIDKSIKYKLSDDFASNLWIDDLWIYYINYKGNEGESCLYRIKKDGTYREKLTDTTVYDLVLCENKIFYSEYMGDFSKNNFQIYSMNKDGEEKNDLENTKGINLQIQGPFLYYLNSEDNYSIHRIRLDNFEKEKLNDVNSKIFMEVHKEWIYFINQDEGFTLYRMIKNGMYTEKLNEDNCSNVIIYNDSIYYCNISEGENYLYKMNLDGSNRQLLIKQDCSREICISNDYIYYVGNDKEGIYRAKIDGNDNRLLIETNAVGLDIVEPFIYYYYLDTKDLTMNLYRMKIDGSQNERVN
ncbi:DUF5050 domain-containing protein [Clostridium niameyense]|uniref:DUF5050 domain-containing protein n=1 Tax=Clostridium niameyense TaxID=1622073 RepID=UPI00067F0A96|nr:DUF5050 domain-containing protein [Clostridium niameyense]